MVDFGNRQGIFDGKDSELTCEQARGIITQKQEHPETEVVGIGRALFHIEFCERCRAWRTFLPAS